MASPFGFQFPNYDLSRTADAVAFLLELLAMALFVHVAANIASKKSSYERSFVAGALGLVLAQVCLDLVPNYSIVGLLLGLVAFCGVAAIVYRGNFRDGVIIGAVSWVLWIAANVALAYVMAHWKA